MLFNPESRRVKMDPIPFWSWGLRCFWKLFFLNHLLCRALLKGLKWLATAIQLCLILLISPILTCALFAGCVVPSCPSHTPRISSHLWLGSCFLLARTFEIGRGGLFHAYYFCISPVHALKPLLHVTLLKEVSSHLHMLLLSPYRLSTTFHTTGYCRLPEWLAQRPICILLL